VVIAGPTAVGKTELSVKLAQHFKTEIVSADARQFYSEMNIGTAKPSQEQLLKVPHHFINNKSITALYGAGHFEKDAIQKLKDLFKNFNIVFMVGGSGLYIDAVLKGVDDFIEIPPDVREHLNNEFENKGLLWLKEETKNTDPIYYLTADTSNPQRMIRALEVFRHTGLPYSSFLNKQKAQREFIPIKILINTEREQLYTQINNRVDRMIELGLKDEVKSLIDYRKHNALKTVGYTEMFDHLDGLCSLSEAIEKIKQHTRNYAKRQITWFKNKDLFQQFKPDEFAEIIAYINEEIKKPNS
jgi:tRNA dimethylallyltransferase